jgi:hypothetical protein
MTDLAAHDNYSSEPTLTESVLSELKAAFADDVASHGVTADLVADVESAYRGVDLYDGEADLGSSDSRVALYDGEADVDSFDSRVAVVNADRDAVEVAPIVKYGRLSDGVSDNVIERSPRMASRLWGGAAAVAVATLMTMMVGNGSETSAADQTGALKLPDPVAAQPVDAIQAGTGAALAITTQDAEVASIAGLLDFIGDIPSRGADLYNNFAFEAKKTDGGRVVLGVVHVAGILIAFRYSRDLVGRAKKLAGVGGRGGF